MARKAGDDNNRLDEHSKRIAALEQQAVYFGAEQREIKIVLASVRDYLFGSANPNEESVKEQLRAILERVEKTGKDFEVDRADTLRIRREGFDRLSVVEGRVEKIEKNSQQVHEVKLLGVKMTAEIRQSVVTAFVSGAFVLLGILLSK